jgi:hypothetical protein
MASMIVEHKMTVSAICWVFSRREKEKKSGYATRWTESLVQSTSTDGRCAAIRIAADLTALIRQNWWRDAMKLRTISDLSHLTYGECLDIVCKRYQRWTRDIVDAHNEPDLFSCLD